MGHGSPRRASQARALPTRTTVRRATSDPGYRAAAGTVCSGEVRGVLHRWERRVEGDGSPSCPTACRSRGTCARACSWSGYRCRHTRSDRSTTRRRATHPGGTLGAAIPSLAGRAPTRQRPPVRPLTGAGTSNLHHGRRTGRAWRQGVDEESAYGREVTDPDTAPSSETGVATGPVTLLDRLLAAGLSAERARTWVSAGGVRVDGQLVTDCAHPAPPPARITLHS